MSNLEKQLKMIKKPGWEERHKKFLQKEKDKAKKAWQEFFQASITPHNK